MMLSSSRLYTVELWIIEELEKNLEGNFHDVIEVLSWNLPRRTEENHEHRQSR
jgi:hypothetical protein